MNYKIDSFRIKIDNDITRAEISRQYLIEADSGEVIDEFKQKSLKIKTETSTIYTSLKRYQFSDDQKGTTLVVLFSAKMAGEQYFSGITKDTIRDVFEILKRSIKINCTFEDFYFYSKVVDVDICKDEIFLSEDDIEQFLMNMKELVKQTPSNHLGRGIKLYRGRKAAMLQCNRRQNAGITHPFVKFYNKSLELLVKHSDFALQFLDIDKIKERPMLRTEFTITDKKMFDAFGLSNKLKDLMRYDDTIYQHVYDVFHDKLFKEPVKETRCVDGISGNKLIIKQLLSYVYNDYKRMYGEYAEIKFHAYIEGLIKEQPSRMSRLRARKIIDSLI